MEYLVYVPFLWLLICLPALIYALVIDRRRREDVQRLESLIAQLKQSVDLLDRRTHVPAGAQHVAVIPPAPKQTPAVSMTAPAPAVAPTIAPPAPAPRPTPQPVEVAKPAAAPLPPPAVAPPQPKPEAPRVAWPAPQQPSPIAKPAPAASAPAAAAAPATSPAKPPAPVVAAPAARVQAPPPPPMRSVPPAKSQYAQAEERKKKAASLEELVGTNWLPKVGIVLLVGGLGYLLSLGWSSFPLWLQVVILYAGAAALLFLGILLERKDAFKVLARVLIGGGWAATFLLTYAIGHRTSIQVLHSEVVDLFLMIAVAAAMVWHTLKYKSQLVTGCAFLLGFAAVTISVSAVPPDPSHLVAGAILVAGMLVIVHRYQWYELEVFGILASYLTHFYWLYKVLGWPPPRAQFPHYALSMALVTGYWAVYRASYVWRKIAGRDQETVSTLAALLNPLLFLGLMRYQSFHDLAWAFYPLLAMGAVEFALGQLPAARRRVAPFRVLSSLGATLMVAAVPCRFAGQDAMPLLWLAGAEAFMLAGILTRERLFRGFGVIISFLVAMCMVTIRLVPWAQPLFDGKPHYDGQLAVVLGTIALVLYANSHLLTVRWRDLFAQELEQLALRVLSFVASAFAVCAVFACIADNVVATVLGLMVLALSWLGRRFAITEFIYQAHWIGAVAFAQVIIVGQPLTAKWLGMPQRVWMFSAVAGLLYLSSRFVRASETFSAADFASGYAWCGSLLLAVLIYFQSPAWAIVLWPALGLALCAAAELFKRSDLKWQAFALVLASGARALLTSFDLNTTATEWRLTHRLVSVSLAAAGIYLLARWAPRKAIRPVYTLIGTLLLALLAYNETPAPWTPVAWISLAALLAVAARWWKDRPLLWQTHALSALAVAWTLLASFTPHYRATTVQLLSVAITGTLLYLLTWITNIDGVIEDERFSHAYSWAASLLVSWLLWSQLPEVDVALAWGGFGLLLFELPGLLRMIGIRKWGSPESWRAQSYVALVSSFVRIFIVNLNTPVAGGFLKTLVEPAVVMVMVLAGIYFWVYEHLHSVNQAKAIPAKAAQGVENLLACLGTAAVAAVAWFCAPPYAVATGLSALVLALMAVAWRIPRRIFLFQALVMLGIATFRLSMHNFPDLNKQISDGLMANSIWALVLLAASLPFAFLVRRGQKPDKLAGWWAFLMRRPEQPVFFITLALVAALLFLKMSGGMVTLAWATEGVLAFILALWVKERSFRLAGLTLVILCVAKIPWDTWQFHDLRRPLSWMGVGAILLLIPYLYGKNRDALREYL